MVACVLGTLDSHDWSTHDSSLGPFGSTHDSSFEAFGSPPHDGSFLEVFGSPPHDGSLLDVFGLPVHELSTNERSHPDAEEKGSQSSTPV